jgi:hypothetical protein
MQGGEWTPALPANRFFATLTLPSPIKGEGAFCRNVSTTATLSINIRW